MVGINEAAGAKGEFAADAALGVETLSERQRVCFTLYRQVVLPLDGFVFWVRASLLGPSATIGSMGFNAAPLNTGPRVVTPAPTLSVLGSLHYSSDNYQLEDESFALNRVVFTAEEAVQDLNAMDETELYIGEFQGVRFAFSQRSSFYRQADLYHYRGDAVYPAMATQIIDTPQDVDTARLVVSNSLPIWLQLNAFAPVYPAFLVPGNLVPPYIAANVVDDSTRAWGMIPQTRPGGTTTQLVSERVRLTTYGLRNDQVMDFHAYVLRYITENDNVMGLMNLPVVKDAKRQQNELGVLAIKKTIEYEVSYYQARVRDEALQLITRVVPSINVAA
jgi:hypothetical protein